MAQERFFRFSALHVLQVTFFISAWLLSNPVRLVTANPIPASQWEPSKGTCRTYCAAMLEVCPHSAFPRYGFQSLADCEEVCPLYPVTRDNNAFWGDSFECRYNHLGYIVSQQLPAVAHCSHASADGGGTCVGGERLDEFDALKTFEKAQLWNGTRSPLGGLLAGVVSLAVQRQHLLFRNLFDSYDLYNDQHPNVSCSSADRRYRTADGRCNSLTLNSMGMTDTRFGKNTPPSFTPASPTNLPPGLLSPDPFLVADKLLKRNQGFQAAEGLNLLIPAWLQFNNHDWFNHGRDSSVPPLCIPMEALSGPNPVNSTGQNSSRALEQGPGCFNLTRTQQSARPGTFSNTVTHWWDASQLYGSDNVTQAKVRTFEGGKLRVVKGPFGEDRLPLETNTGLPVTGFNDNWWVGLSLMHTLFVKEHNAVAAAIQAAEPHLSDEDLFQKARLVVSAVIAKIHTLEWTPTILGLNPVLATGMDVNWHGLSADIPIPSGFDTGLLESPGTRGIADRTYYAGTPFSLTEEFVAVYRMHPLLPETITVVANSTANGTDSNGANRNGTVFTTASASFAGAEALLDRESFQDWLYALGTGTPGALTLNNYPDFLTTLVHPTRGSLNMAAIDIVRDRERGVMRYNAFRRALQLTPVQTFEDLTSNATVVALLKSVYPSVEDLDLLVGCLAEEPRPRGFAFGETAFTIFLQMASRRLMTDRFFQEDFTADVYSQTGIEWVNQATFNQVLLRHFPELGPALDGLPNPFVTWNTPNQTTPPSAISFLPNAYQVENAKLTVQGKTRPGLQNRGPQPTTPADVLARDLANQPDITLDDLPGNPVVDCSVANLLTPMKSCLGGASELCCAAIDAAFAPGTKASTRNCLCLPPVATAGLQVALGFGVDFDKVLSDCWTDYGLQTNWYGETNGHCPALPPQSDPYTWRSLAPNMVILLLIYWFLSGLIHRALRRWVVPYRKLSVVKQRNVITYFLEIVVTSAAFVLTLVYGWHILVAERAGGYAAASNARLGLLLVATLYVFELVYRNETGISLAVHHLVTILLILLLVFSSADESPSAEARSFQRFGLLLSLHASTEQLTFVGLAMYRLGHPWAARVMKISTWQTLVFKVVIHLLTWTLLINFFVNDISKPSASHTSNDWHMIWPIIIPFLDTLLFASQLYALYIIHVLARRFEATAGGLARPPAGTEGEAEETLKDNTPRPEPALVRARLSRSNSSLQRSLQRAATYVRNASVAMAREDEDIM